MNFSQIYSKNNRNFGLVNTKTFNFRRVDIFLYKLTYFADIGPHNEDFNFEKTHSFREKVFQLLNKFNFYFLFESMIV